MDRSNKKSPNKIDKKLSAASTKRNSVGSKWGNQLARMNRKLLDEHDKEGRIRERVIKQPNFPSI